VAGARHRGTADGGDDDSVHPVTGDRVDFALNGERGDEARTWLEAHGWKREASQAAAETKG
jgi:hypothetical protein